MSPLLQCSFTVAGQPIQEFTCPHVSNSPTESLFHWSCKIDFILTVTRYVSCCWISKCTSELIRGIIICVLLFCILLCGMMFLTRIRTMQAELAEKEMLIKILQHHASLSRSSSISSLLLPSSSSPLHSPHHRSPTNAAYMMSMSVPASGATSRQSSQVDDDQMYSCTSREQDQRPVHVKSSTSKSRYHFLKECIHKKP